MVATDVALHAPADATMEMTRIMGQFVSYELKDGYKVKRINLQTAAGLVSAKLTPAARAGLFRISTETPIQPGLWLDLTVKVKLDAGIIKYKVQDLQTVSESTALAWIAANPTALIEQNSPQKTVIRVCDRGTCRKRGATQIIAALEQAIRDQDLGRSVEVQATSCLKNCKCGPNLRVGKAQHDRLCPVQALQLLPAIVPRPKAIQPMPSGCDLATV